MRLIVAEKPSVGRDIASALGRHRREKGSLSGEGWTVTWALGHLAGLAPPDAYGEEYKKWRLESLPILPGRFKVRVNHKTREQFDVVKGLMRNPAVTEVVNACDAGREGELIFAYLYGLSGCRKPVLRLWISSLTHEAIREGFDALRAGRCDETSRRRGPQPGGGRLDRRHERHPRLFGPLRRPWKRALCRPCPDPDPEASRRP